MTIKFFVAGIPRPGGSKRHVGGGRIIESCKHTAGWREAVAWAARNYHDGPLLDGPLRVRLEFVMPRPKAHYGTGKRAGELKTTAPAYHTTKPDTTKLIRSTEDALTHVVWKDDALIAEQQASKVYGDKPGAWVTIKALDGR